MAIKKNGNKFLSILFWLIITVGTFFSCTPDEVDAPVNRPNTPGDGYMRLTFDLPGFETPSSRPATRDMSAEGERAIDKNRLHVFVFNENSIFAYKAPVLSDSYTEDAEKKTATVTIKLVKATEPTEKNTVVVLANYDLPDGLDLEDGVTTIAGLYKQCVYSMPGDGKWKSDAPIPMWGEAAGIEVTEKNMPNVAIFLRRAMARIDVGLNFSSNEEGKLSENAAGVDHFKIGEVKIFHTYNQGLVGSLNDDLSVANIPEGAARRGNDNPLEFIVPDDPDGKGSNRFVREIYLPQSDRPMTENQVDATNVHCVVVGGYYGGSSEITYYRMDFADKYPPGSQTPDYLDIAGNYRYVFNITGVTGPGFPTYEEALRSTPSIEYALIKWDESIHEMQVQGKYYFGLDNREVTLQAIKTEDNTKNLRVIKYQTNYPVTNADGITFEWANPTDADHPSVSPYFKAEWTGKGEKGEITITALTTNETNSVLTDQLHVKLGAFTIEVKVNQEYVNFKYTLDCAAVTVFGTYRPGAALNTVSADPPTHRIELTITAEDESIFGSTYEIYTEPIYGIEFKAEGIFRSLNETVVLKGEGTLDTPTDARTDPFTVTIHSNSSAGSYCEATISPVMPLLRILSIANDNSTYNYDITRSNGGAYKVLKSENNFGPHDHSIVKIEKLELIRGTSKTGLLATEPLAPEALEWLQEGSIINGEKYLADILYIGHDALYTISDKHDTDHKNAQIIMDYMKNGGVVVMFDEGISGPRRIFSKMFFSPGTDVSVGYRGASQGLFAFPGHPKYEKAYIPPSETETWDKYFSELQNDPILFGPFGDIRDKQWGEDSHRIVYLTTPAIHNNPNVTIYTYATEKNDDVSEKSRVSGFKYESNDINLVWFGDGGFMSSDHGKPGSDVNICPFYWDTKTFFPTFKPNYKGGTAYNSQAFCNIMAWAIDRSMELKPKRDAAIGN